MVDIKLSTNKSVLLFLVFSAITLTFKAQVIKQCEYEMVVNTGATRGPTFKLGVILDANSGSSIRNSDIVKNWGVMGRKHTYFLPNSSDRFKTTLPCVPRNFCWIGIEGEKGVLKPYWTITNVTIATKGDGGIDRLKTFGFDPQDPIRTVYPYASDGECP